MSWAEIAAKHRIKESQVRDILSYLRSNPRVLGHRMAQQNLISLEALVTGNVVRQMQRRGERLTGASLLSGPVSAALGREVQPWRIRRAMKGTLGLRYRRQALHTTQVNTVRCLVQRQRYAMAMLPILEERRRVINVDESWLNWTNQTTRAWQDRSQSQLGYRKQIHPRLSVLAAIDTDGGTWYSLSHGNTTTETMALFLEHLFGQLELETPGWRKSSLLLLDGARYHVAAEMREFLDAQEVAYMYTAPYSYTSSPIERIFAALKRDELNPEKLPTGKR